MSLFALDIIVRASALLAAAALADLVLRRRASAATRHLLWTLALGALLALPIASYVLPEWTVPIPIARPFAPPVAARGQTPARGDLGSDPNAHPLGRTRVDSMDSQWRKTGGLTRIAGGGVRLRVPRLTRRSCRAVRRVRSRRRPPSRAARPRAVRPQAADARVT